MLKITIGGAHWRSDRDVHVPGQRWPLPGMTSHTRTCTARQPRRHAVQLRHGIIKLSRCWIHKIRGFCKRADYGWVTHMRTRSEAQSAASSPPGPARTYQS